MISAAVILNDLASRGIAVRLAAGLRLSLAPAGLLEAADKATVREHQDELVQALLDRLPSVSGCPWDGRLLSIMEADLGLEAGTLDWVEQPPPLPSGYAWCGGTKE